MKDGSKEVTGDDNVNPYECALLVKKHCWCHINPDDSVSTNKTEEGGGDYNYDDIYNEDKESGVKASGQDSGEKFSGKLNISDNTDRLMGKTIVEANKIAKTEQIFINKSLGRTIEEAEKLARNDDQLELLRDSNIAKFEMILLMLCILGFKIKTVRPVKVDGKVCDDHNEPERFNTLNVEIENQKIVKILGTG